MTDKITTREFWIKEPGTGVLREGTLSPPADGEVRVRALYSAVSRGTESLVFRGEVPESQWKTMRCPFQEGEFPGPVKYGYMSVGRVEEGVGKDAERLVGRVVFCLHPHQDRYVVPVSSVVPVPETVPAERAVVAANMETAVNAVWDGRPRLGDRVVVVGGGTVGLLIAWLTTKMPGTRVTVVDPHGGRRESAEHLGLDFAVGPDPEWKADLVVHASGNPEGARDALTVAGEEATVLEVSWFGDREVRLPLGEDFHARRLTLRGSQVSRIPAEQTPRWDHRRRMALALRLLEDPVLDVLFTGESPFEALPSVMERLATEGEDTLCHRIRYPRPGAG
ncbi:MAG: zinc-binding alcohol dehydrogenase [Longimicrobiales bacterium]|nr:zinc-binding alcohol dehydrogenase [Longimicrobiales bacterium]